MRKNEEQPVRTTYPYSLLTGTMVTGNAEEEEAKTGNDIWGPDMTHNTTPDIWPWASMDQEDSVNNDQECLLDEGTDGCLAIRWSGLQGEAV